MKKKLIDILARWLAGRVFRSAERGEYGSGVARLYAATKGRKRLISFLLWVAVAIATIHAPGLVPALGTVALIASVAGFSDWTSRMPPPEAPEGVREAYGALSAMFAGAGLLVYALEMWLGGIPGCPECTAWSHRIELWSAGLAVAASTFAGYLDGKG